MCKFISNEVFTFHFVIFDISIITEKQPSASAREEVRGHRENLVTQHLRQNQEVLTRRGTKINHVLTMSDLARAPNHMWETTMYSFLFALQYRWSLHDLRNASKCKTKAQAEHEK